MSIELSIVLAVFIVILPAELPDKTMISTVVLASKYSPIIVWIGASTAFLLQVILAVSIGSLLVHIPKTYLEVLVSFGFAAGGVWLLVSKEKEQEDEAREIEEEITRKTHKVLLLAFAVIFIGEFGDLTQLMTVNFAAKYHSWLSVAIGATLALWIVSAIGAFGGSFITKFVHLSTLRKIAGIILVGFGVISFAQSFLKL